MKSSQKEVSMFWTDNDTGIECKGRMDGFSKLYNVVYDVKTTKDCIAFRKQFFSLRYQIQVAYYMDAVHTITGTMPNVFLLYAVEKEPPYLSKFYNIYPGDESFIIGRDEYKYLLNRYSECENNNNFDIAFENDVEHIEYAPAWYNKLTQDEAF
jgi:exodeoxyribonuclease VIII